MDLSDWYNVHLQWRLIKIYYRKKCKDLMHCSYKLTHTDLVKDLLGKWYASMRKRPHLWKKKKKSDKLINCLEKCLERQASLQMRSWWHPQEASQRQALLPFYQGLNPPTTNPYFILIINSDWICKWFYSFALLFENIVHFSIDMAHKLNCARFYSSEPHFLPLFILIKIDMTLKNVRD